MTTKLSAKCNLEVQLFRFSFPKIKSYLCKCFNKSNKSTSYEFCRRTTLERYDSKYHTRNGRIFAERKTSGYVGIDPTADSLHIGHLVGIMMLKHLQRAGHTPIALIGGATGMIGDPSMKSAERKLLDEETLRHNQAAIKMQLAKFLDFESNIPNKAVMVNNYDWMKEYTFLSFIRDVGKHITVNYMMAKDSVKKT